MEYRETDTEFIYATSRQVAGILDTGDGSYGAAAVKAMTTIGMVSREMLGADGTYSGDRAKEWGRTGPPHDLETKAAPYKLGSAALVSTWDDLVAAITNGYPVTICTNQGFSLTRDSDGFCEAQGTWGHCMVIGGLRSIAQGHAFSRVGDPICPAGRWPLTNRAFPSGPSKRPSRAFLARGIAGLYRRLPPLCNATCRRPGSTILQRNGFFDGRQSAAMRKFDAVSCP